MDLISRVTNTQTTIDNFLHSEFIWGQGDCGQLAGQHLENLGIATPLADAGNYRTERGAKLALCRLGASSMEDVVDGLGFERIAPASAIVGDIVGLPGGQDDKPWTALGVHVGGAQIMAFAHVAGDGPTCELGPIDVCSVAWRVA